MMKKIFFLLYTFTINILQAQTTITYNYTDLNGYSCKSQLLIMGKESIFIIDDPRKEVNSTNSLGEPYKLYNDKWSRIFYKNSNTVLTRIPIYGKEIVYSCNEQKVKLKKNFKTIANYECQEAEVVKGNRVYSVWFHKNIPINYGPVNLNGIPGLIVEISDSSNSKFKISLEGISKTIDQEKFDRYKDFILSKKALTCDNYKKEIVDLLKNTKIKNYAIMAQYDSKINYAEDQSYFTKHIVDIPDNLVKELQKIRQ
jgi:GLPGLI family protein